MKLYFINIKSHCEAPDFEAEVEVETQEEAVDAFYGMLKGEYDKKFIKQNMGFEELIEAK